MVDSVKNNSKKSQKDTSQCSTNTATSTLSLFTTILSKAESDYLAASTSSSSKAKLFHIATQLARLNLSEEIEGEDDTATTEQAIQLWCIFLKFIIRYPDYALYRIIDNGSTSQAKQQEKKKKEGGRVNGTNDQQEEQHDGENGNRQHEEENDDDEDEQQGEEMIYWLLPRLLRAIALSNSHSSPRSRRKQQTESSEHNDLEQAQRDEHVEKDENDITQQGEQWISNVIENYSRIFYHREEGGLGKRRYLVKVLMKIANDASLLANATTPSFFPSKLWIHSKITSKNPTSLVNIKNDNSFFAEKEMSNGDKSPFFIKIQNLNQAKTIRISIIRILIDTLSKSDIWMNDLINDITELLIGSSQDWQFKPSSSFGQIARKSKKEAFIGRLHELQHRVECATDIFRLARRLPIAHASLSALFTQVIALALSKQVDAYRSKMHARRYADITSEDQQPPEDEEWTALLALEEAIVDCFMILYNSIGDPSSRPRLFPILHIARRHRTRLFEILRFEGCEEYRPSDAQATVTHNGKKTARSIPFRIVPASWPRAAISVILIFFGCKVSLPSPVNSQDVCDLAPNERMAIDIACGRLVDLSKQPPFPQAGFAEGHKESLYRIMNDLDEQARNDWKVSNAEEYEPNKRKTAPGVEDEELAARLQKREKHKEARLQKLIEDTFPPEVAEKSKVNSKAWQDVIAAYFLEAARSSNSTLEQSQLEAVAILACDHAKDERAPAMSGNEHAAVNQACKLCTRNFIMANLEPRDLLQDATFSSTLLSAMQPVHAQICKSSATLGMHVAFWRAFTSLILHNGEHPHLLLSWLDRILQDMTHKKRLVRLAAGYAGNSLITEMYRHNANINPQGALSRLFRGMENVVRSGKPACRLTMATTVADLIRVGSGPILGKALSMGIIILSAKGQLRATFTAQLDGILKVREVAPYRFFSPYLHLLCPIIARNLDASYTLLYTFTDLLRTTARSFLQTPDIARIFLSEAILAKRQDMIQVLAECAEVSQAEFLVVNADCCFAPLYFNPISKFEECKSFFMHVLQSQSVKTSFQQTLESDLPAVLLEVLIRADPNKPEQLDTIIQRIFRDVKHGQSLSVRDANKLLSRSGTVLAVFGRAGDSLRGMYGKKSPEERARLLQAMEILVARVGEQVSGAIPQVMTILQTCFRDSEIRLPTLRLWDRFLKTLIISEVKPLIAQSTAVFVQTWSSLSQSEKAVVKDIFQYLLVEEYRNLDDALSGIADMSGIPELDAFQKRLEARRQGQSSEERIEAYLRRLDTVNEATLMQTLRELLQFLKAESTTIHKLASGSSFSPLLGETIHSLLSTAIRSSENKSSARPLALQCLGVLGALDPDRVTFPPEETAFVIEHDLRSAEECMKFALNTIDKVLLRVLRTTNDPQQQTALYLAIQGLAAVCGFDENLRSNNTFNSGVDPHIRSRWNALPRHMQDVMEPLISASIKVESSVKAEEPEYPLYRYKSSYRDWLQTWTSALIDHLVQGHSGITVAYSPGKLFGPLRAAVRRGHDLTVPHYVLPFLVFYTITSGNTVQAQHISQEIQTVLQDQINPSTTIAMSRESRSLCAQAIFELMDKLNTWRRARLVLVTKAFRRKELHDRIEGELKYIKKVDLLFQSLPQNMVADAAFNAKSHARALLNYEKILYQIGPKKTISEKQNYYERLHSIYAELNEPDGMEGVSVSIISPSLQHQIREHEMTGRWTSAQSCWEVQLQLEPDNPASHLGLLRCLRNLGHYDSLRTHIAGLQVKHVNWQNALSPYELESALIAGNLPALKAALDHADPSCPEAAFARVVLASTESPVGPSATAFLEAAETLGSTITTASKDSYHRFYDTVVKLHMLHEVETLFSQATVGGAAHRRQSKADQANFASRLELTSPAFNTREAILNMRRNAYRLCGAEEHSVDIGPLWLTTSKIAIKANHLQTAYSAILQATQLRADFTFMQSAKLYYANGHLHRALQELEQGLKLLGALEPGAASKLTYDAAMLKKLAKATLRSARWMQETGRFDQVEILGRYTRAVKLCTEWEAVHYRLGQYADDQIQASPPFERKPAEGSRQVQMNAVLLNNMELCVHYFSRALRYGAKYVYQALPRLVTIWLDMGAWPDLATLPVEILTPGKDANAAGTSTAKYVSTSGRMAVLTVIVDRARKIEQQRSGLSSTVKSAISTFEKINGHIRRSLEKIPAYMWLSVLPQLVSRIYHENAAVYNQLVYLIERVIQHYPQQAMWTMMSVLHSANAPRKERCSQILRHAQQSLATGGANHNQRGALTAIITAMQQLVKSFLEMAAMKIDNPGSISMSTHFPALKAMVPCEIIIPLQNAMTVTFPTDEKVFAHKPFPSNLVTFQAFRDEVDIMSSVAKPRKIVIIGSDGKTYRFLCKPMDDLRKDNRFNECTSLIGKLLRKDADARKRGLCIRSYAVIPLSETCGLIEWVPDTQGIRALFIQCYEPRGISVWNEHLRKVYESIKGAQKNDPVKCGQVFKEQILTVMPPIFHEWFMSNFPEPTAWLKARTNYGRTAAVMSMVGFVFGLGDRHGENILIDTTNGDVVHVDFNCLFGMGQVHFDIVEKVPFRLTQNIIDGFGITGVEGVFRRCCEITLRILRENRNSLISVLESFVHDPLLDLQLTRPKAVERKAIGSGRNESKEQKARREEEQRKTEARGALATISHKLKGTQSTTFGPPGDTVSSVEMTVETLFKEATDPKNLGGLYMGWAAWL